MLRIYFDSLQPDSKQRISESWVQLDAKWVIAQTDLANTIASVLRHVANISHRDHFELLLDAGESRLSAHKDNFPDAAEVEAFLLAAEDLEELEASLVIRKQLADGSVSIYFIEHFASYLSKTPLPAALRAGSSLLYAGVRFEVFGNLPRAFRTDAIRFDPAGTALPATAIILGAGRQEKLQAFQTNTNASGLPADVLPSDFYLSMGSGVGEIDAFFDRASAVLSLAFLANTFELLESGNVSYKFYGYKAVVHSDVELQKIASAAKTLYALYAWAYEGGSPVDKLGLVRNVVSIHLDDQGNPKFDQEVLDAVHSNYQIYLKGNIQSYLEIKNKIAELLLDSVERTARAADEVLDSFKNNVFIVATFILTVVVINGIKDTGFNAMFSGPYVLLMGFLALCSILWLFLVRGDAFKRYETSAESMESLLRSSYRQFLMGAELDGVLTPTLNKNKAILKERVRTYTVWWLTLLVLLVAVFCIGNYLFAAVPSGVRPSEMSSSPAARGELSTPHGVPPEGSAASVAGDAKQTTQSAGKLIQEAVSHKDELTTQRPASSPKIASPTRQ